MMAFHVQACGEEKTIITGLLPKWEDRWPYFRTYHRRDCRLQPRRIKPIVHALFSFKGSESWGKAGSVLIGLKRETIDASIVHSFHETEHPPATSTKRRIVGLMTTVGTTWRIMAFQWLALRVSKSPGASVRNMDLESSSGWSGGMTGRQTGAVDRTAMSWLTEHGASRCGAMVESGCFDFRGSCCVEAEKSFNVCWNIS